MTASEDSPPEGQERTGESDRLKCFDCGEVWTAEVDPTETVACPGCGAETAWFDVRYRWLVESPPIGVSIRVDPPAELVELAEMRRDAHGVEPEDSLADLVDITWSFPAGESDRG